MEEWNGVSLLWDIGLQKPNLQTYTDASDTWILYKQFLLVLYYMYVMVHIRSF